MDGFCQWGDGNCWCFPAEFARSRRATSNEHPRKQQERLEQTSPEELTSRALLEVFDDRARSFGTLRRELLDHVIVRNEQHLRRLPRRFLDECYHPCRTHLSLGKDAPETRPWTFAHATGGARPRPGMGKDAVPGTHNP